MAARGDFESSGDSDFELPPPSSRRRTTSASSRVLSISRSLRQRAIDQSQFQSESPSLSMDSSSEGASTSSTSGLPRMTTAARRLNQVVRHGLSVVNSRRNAAELATSFPFLSQSSQSNRISALTGSQARIRRPSTRKWKTTPCLLNGYMNSLEWSGRMERWNGAVEWTTGLEYWSIGVLEYRSIGGVW